MQKCVLNLSVTEAQEMCNKALKDGKDYISPEFTPSDYGLLDERDVEKPNISDFSEDELIDELESRHGGYCVFCEHDEGLVKMSQRRLEKDRATAREYMCDMMRLQRTASDEQLKQAFAELMNIPA